MLSLYAKWKGFTYLRDTLHKILDRLMMTSQELDLELDPARVASVEELKKNAAQLQIVAKVFMDDICASAPSIPPSFRKICSIVGSSQRKPLYFSNLLTNLTRFTMRYYRASLMPSIRQLELSSSCASSVLRLLHLKPKVSLISHRQKSCVEVCSLLPRLSKI